MILNAYAILDTFVSLLRLPLGLLVLGLGGAAWRHSRRGASPEDRKALEERNHLLALLLLGLNLGSWALLYLLLQSYVPEWPGATCIYGVLLLGAGSVGSSRFLRLAHGGRRGAFEDCSRPWLSAAVSASNLALVAALLLPARRGRLALLVAGACLTSVVSSVFRVEVASPTLIHQPDHHCPYDLVAAAPEALLAVALAIAGIFSVGWAWVARWLANCRETAPFLEGTVGRLLFTSRCGSFGSVVLTSAELALA